MIITLGDALKELMQEIDNKRYSKRTQNDTITSVRHTKTYSGSPKTRRIYQRKLANL